jgi:hypothetical protein
MRIRDNDDQLRQLVDDYLDTRARVLLGARGDHAAEGRTELDAQTRAMALRDYWRADTVFVDCDAAGGDTWWSVALLLEELDARAVEAVESQGES